MDLQKDAPAYHFTYSYDEKEDNFNGRTIQKFSTNAEEDMWKCLDCPMAEYSKFVKYYNAYDYGDQFIQAALNSEATNFTHGNADFTDHGRASRVEALVVATKFMNIYMYVIRMLEHGLNQCRLVCGKRCDDSPVRAWDQAVAYYTGSLEGESGSGSGLLMYDLADRMCVVFRTCGDDATLDYGTSYVNNKIMEEFAKGQAHLLKRECDDVVESKERIVKLMAVPLIQATLFAAYFQSAFPAVEKDDMAIFRVEGATYAASVLPLVHHCHPQDALAIHDNLRVERAVDWNDEANSEVDFLAVKDAFEHSYNCMGVTCDSVGGIWVDKAYSPDAAPCRGAADQNDGASPGGIFAIVVFSVVFVFSLSLVAMYRYHNGRDRNFVEEPVENLHVEDVVVDSQGFD